MNKEPKDISSLKSVLLSSGSKKNINSKIQENEEKFRAITSSARDAIIMMDGIGNINYWNKAAEIIFGYTCTEALGNELHIFLAPSRYHNAYLKAISDFRAKGKGALLGKTLELMAVKKDGTQFPIELSVSAVKIKHEWNAVGIIRDITQRKLVENELRESEGKYSNLFRNSNDAIFIHDLNGSILDANPKATQLFGFTGDEMRSISIQDIHPPSAVMASQQAFKKISKDGVVKFEIDFKTKKGKVFSAEVSSSMYEVNGNKIIQGIVRDITERKKAEEELRDSEGKFRSVVENSPNAILVIDDKFCISYVNDQISQVLGYIPKDILDKDFRSLLDNETRQALEKLFIQRQQGKFISPRYEFKIKRRDGIERYVEITSVVLTTSSGRRETVAQLTDLTERKLALQNEIQHIRDITFLSKTAMRFVELPTEENIYTVITEALKKLVANSIVAIVSYQEENKDFQVQRILGMGRKMSLVTKLVGKVPIGMKIPAVAVVVDPLTKGKLIELPWDLSKLTGGDINKDISLKLKNLLGVKKIHIIGFTRKGKLYGGAVILDVKDSGLANNKLIEAFINQASIALQRNRTQQELKVSFQKLRRTLEETVEALASAVEIKDPYTAGHQKRVSRLASSIAETMGLSEDKVRGIHLAAAIHDIGKIYIPSEILTKPERLSSIEFDLIKTHPQVGYDILKSIDFPWPIAQIILQHHEKINGSGYPHGVKGKNICLEAKILVVADIVEAISSHRPYRPALGLEKALKEISDYRNVLFDPKVVDACLKLFRKLKFIL